LITHGIDFSTKWKRLKIKDEAKSIRNNHIIVCEFIHPCLTLVTRKAGDARKTLQRLHGNFPACDWNIFVHVNCQDVSTEPKEISVCFVIDLFNLWLCQ
jgi:hypothetical protein